MVKHCNRENEWQDPSRTQLVMSWMVWSHFEALYLGAEGHSDLQKPFPPELILCFYHLLLAKSLFKTHWQCLLRSIAIFLVNRAVIRRNQNSFLPQAPLIAMIVQFLPTCLLWHLALMADKVDLQKQNAVVTDIFCFALFHCTQLRSSSTLSQ